MLRSPPPRIRLPGHEHRARDVRQRRHLAVAQRDVDVLPLARLLPREQRRHHGVARVQSRGQVRDRDADLDGRPVARARDVHEPELSLDHDVVAGALAVGSGLAVAGDGGVDELRVELAEGGVVERVLGEGAGDEVLYEDVDGSDEGV